MSLGAVITAVEAELSTPGLVKRTGSPEVQTNDSVPRVVWVVTRERLAPPIARMGEPGCLWVRSVSIDAHLWGGTPAATESLIDDVLRAFNKACKGQFAYRPTGAAWDIDQRFDVLGALVVLTVEVDIPVERAASTWAEVAEWPTTLIIRRNTNPPSDGDDVEIEVP